MNEFIQVDDLVEQVKGNSRFLHKIIFSRVTIITMAVVTAVFLIAAMSIN